MYLGWIGFLLFLAYVVGSVIIGLFILEPNSQGPIRYLFFGWVIISAIVLNWWLYLGHWRRTKRFNRETGEWEKRNDG